MKKIQMSLVFLIILTGCAISTHYRDGQKTIWRKYSGIKWVYEKELVYDSLSNRRITKAHSWGKRKTCGGDYKYECIVAKDYRLIIYDSLGRKAEKVITASCPWYTGHKSPKVYKDKYYKRK